MYSVGMPAQSGSEWVLFRYGAGISKAVEVREGGMEG